MLLALAFAVCASCKNTLKSTLALDAGPESLPDATAIGDSPAGPTGGTAGGPGSGGPGGSGGSRLDAPGSGGAMTDGGVVATGGDFGCPYPNGFVDSGVLCGSVSVSTTRRPVEVLLVFDRSSSMRKSLAEDCLCAGDTGEEDGILCSSNAADCTDRWTVMKSAVSQTIADASGIHWGIELLPSTAEAACSVSPTPQVPMGADSGALVQAQLDVATPGGHTPTAAAITTATVYLSALSDQNRKYILLATDGESNCGVAQSNPTASDLEDTIAAITAASRAGFPVYVIGVGPNIGNLDHMAQVGGTGTHHPATSPEQLTAALSWVFRMTMSCSLSLPGQPPDPNNVAVYANKQLVPKDSTNGWTYGATNSTIELTGSYCEGLMVAQDMTIQVLFGCSSATSHLPTCIP